MLPPRQPRVFARLARWQSAIKITEESVEETVTVLVVENSVGGKLLCEQTVSLRSPAPISSIRVSYKMERGCAWCLEMESKLAKVIVYCNVKNGICLEAICLALRTARKSRDMNGNATF